MGASGSLIHDQEYDLQAAYQDGGAPKVVPLGDVNQVTMPDLHGNVMGAMLRLEACGVLKIQDKDRARLSAIYQNGGKKIVQCKEMKEGKEVVEHKEIGECLLTDDEFAEFESILERAEVNTDKIKCVRFIGDVLGDRGKNDIFMLCLLLRLKKSDLYLKIIFSNHDLQFIAWYLGTVTNTRNTLRKMKIGQTRSLENFISFVRRERAPDEQNKWISKVDTFIDSYKSMVKLMEYSYDDKVFPPCLELYPHAPVGIEAIEGLCKLGLFNITFDESSPQALARIIDQINARFRELLISNSKALFDEIMREDKCDGINPKDTPLLYISWNRELQNIRGPQNKSFVVKINHGHAGSNISSFWKFNEVQGINLDCCNSLGFSGPESDAEYPLGLGGPLNCYLSKGPIAEKVLLVDFDGVLFSEDREVACRLKEGINAWFERERKNVSPEDSEKLQQEFNRRLVPIGSIRSPRLLQMIFQECKNAGIHCILATQRIRKGHELAASLESELTKAGLKELLHWEDAQHIVKDIKETEEKGHDKLMMANAVMNNMMLVNCKEHIYLVDDSKHIYGGTTPYSSAGYQFHDLNVAEKGGEEYFEALQAWPNLMKKLGVEREKVEKVRLMIDVLRVTHDIEKYIHEEPPNFKKVYETYHQNAFIITQAKMLRKNKQDEYCVEDVTKLINFANFIEKNKPKDWIKIHRAITKIKEFLHKHNLKEAYRVVQENVVLINDAKKTIAKEKSAIMDSDMKILILLAQEVENIAPSLWKRMCLGFLGGAVIGGLAGTIIPGIGNVFGGLIGGISGAVVAGVGFGVGVGLLGAGLGTWSKY